MAEITKSGQLCWRAPYEEAAGTSLLIISLSMRMLSIQRNPCKPKVCIFTLGTSNSSKCIPRPALHVFLSTLAWQGGCTCSVSGSHPGMWYKACFLYLLQCLHCTVEAHISQNRGSPTCMYITRPTITTQMYRAVLTSTVPTDSVTLAMHAHLQSLGALAAQCLCALKRHTERKKKGKRSQNENNRVLDDSSMKRIMFWTTAA